MTTKEKIAVAVAGAASAAVGLLVSAVVVDLGRPWAGHDQTMELADRVCQRFGVRLTSQERTLGALLVHVTCDGLPTVTFAIRWDDVREDGR